MPLSIKSFAECFGLKKSEPEPCVDHYVDNQGFCHQCGILMDESLAIDYYGRKEWVKISHTFERIA